MRSIFSQAVRRVFFSITLPLSAVSLLAGCSTVSELPGFRAVIGEEGYLRDRQGDYLDAQTVPRTQVPDGLDSYIIDDLYVIPEAPANDDYYFVPPRPRPLEGNSERQVVIQRIEDRSWIVVGLSPSQVWPRISDYWASKRVPISAEDPSRGVMETGWFRLQDREGERQKFRIMVEPGFQDNSAEVRLLNLGVSDEVVQPDAVSFPAESTDPELETEFLRDLSGFLADLTGAYQAGTVSFMAGNISSEGKASLQTGSSGDTILHLRSSFERSWGAIGLALDRAEVEIVQQSRDLGVYEVIYTPREEDEEEPGFFGRLFSFGEQGPLRMEVRLLPVNEETTDDETINVEVQNLEPESVRRDTEDPEASLLRLLRNTIA